MSQNISFKSYIRVVPCKDFSKETAKMVKNRFVAYPWTIKESVKADSAFTRDIADCTVCGITDGKDVVLMHLSPDVEANHSLNGLQRFIAQNVNLKNPNLQGILIGSKLNKISSDIYDKLAKLLETYNIPFSELRAGNGKVNTAYFSNKDEWMVSSLTMDKFINKGYDNKTVLNNMFHKVSISDLDEIV